MLKGDPNRRRPVLEGRRDPAAQPVARGTSQDKHGLGAFAALAGGLYAALRFFGADVFNLAFGFLGASDRVRVYADVAANHRFDYHCCFLL